MDMLSEDDLVCKNKQPEANAKHECKNNVIFEVVWLRPTQIFRQYVFSLCLRLAIVMW